MGVLASRFDRRLIFHSSTSIYIDQQLSHLSNNPRDPTAGELQRCDHHHGVGAAGVGGGPQGPLDEAEEGEGAEDLVGSLADGGVGLL